MLVCDTRHRIDSLNFREDIVSVEVEVESRKFQFFGSVKISYYCRQVVVNSRGVKSEDASGDLLTTSGQVGAIMYQNFKFSKVKHRDGRLLGENALPTVHATSDFKFNQKQFLFGNKLCAILVMA